MAKKGSSTSKTSKTSHPAEVDRVAIPSRKADGTADQTDGYEQITRDED
jgi:hypothetical protein